jgi:DNA-binding beta-propeller fold protein YncE
MVTQLVAGRVYDYGRTVGRGAVSGMGFNSVVDLALGEGDLVYVLNRGWEFVTNVPWNRTARGTRVSVITIGDVPGDEEFVAEFSKYGDGEGELIWPAGIAIDSQGRLYITDEWLNRISVFDKDRNFLGQWGRSGGGDGELDGPSGIAIDPEDDVYVVDSRNHRIQKFTTDGSFLSQWGSLGSDEGQLNSPWGITLDGEGYVYIADHKNNRAQKFTREGEFVASFGSYGTGRGQLNRPSDVAVDPDGDVYVCDWANNRVQLFAPDGRFITSFIGNAQELSKWARMVVEVNPESLKRRREVRTLEPEWRLALPRSVAFDQRRGRLVIADTQRNRLQIYNKLKQYAEPQRNL